MRSIINIIYTTVCLTICMALCSCAEWLDVQPVDMVTEDQLYSSETGAQKALNGLYLLMAEKELYGRELTTHTVELLAQQYNIADEVQNITGSKYRYYLSHYNYDEETTKSRFLSIWTAAYDLIMQTNFFIGKLDNTSDKIVAPSRKNIMLGEAYAVRAYMHFDLLRLFGPVLPDETGSLTIPYCTLADANLQAMETADAIIEKIMLDIDKALARLENDPVRTMGPRVGSEYTGDAAFFFNSYRNRRLNYYAVQALRMRVCMYCGDTDGALDAAQVLLGDEGIASKFPWTSRELAEDARKPDRIFSDEVLFGVHAGKMYEDWTSYFSPGVTPNVLLARSKKNVDAMFDGAQWTTGNDLRAQSWIVHNNNSYICSTKFSRPADEDNADFLYFRPLIRKSEIYYLMSELTDENKYIDEVRVNRGLMKLGDLGMVTDLTNELYKEYQREFFGEGQLFFYYKRVNRPEIPYGTNDEGQWNMTRDGRYRVPVPQKELDEHSR